MSKIYVAYGSNLNLEQMSFRCPTAKLIATGMIDNYELQFKGRPNCSFATIAPKQGSSVPVALWKITPFDELMLDRYEGYPNSYFKKDISVNVGGRDVQGMVYIMNLKQNFGLPSEGYYDTVAQGYMDCGLDINVLNKAVNDSADKYYEQHPEEQPESFDLCDDEDEGFGDMTL